MSSGVENPVIRPGQVWRHNRNGKTVTIRRGLWDLEEIDDSRVIGEGVLRRDYTLIQDPEENLWADASEDGEGGVARVEPEPVPCEPQEPIRYEAEFAIPDTQLPAHVQGLVDDRARVIAERDTAQARVRELEARLSDVEETIKDAVDNLIHFASLGRSAAPGYTRHRFVAERHADQMRGVASDLRALLDPVSTDGGENRG